MTTVKPSAGVMLNGKMPMRGNKNSWRQPVQTEGGED